MRRDVDQIRNYLFGGGYPDPVSNAEQLAFLFFFYLVEGIDAENMARAKVLKQPYESMFKGSWTLRNPLNAPSKGETTIPKDRFRWSVWATGLSGEPLVRFLRDEILAEVGKKYKLRQDSYSRAIGGDSSGGICAFNAAYTHPELFTRVLSRIGSFTSIQWKPGVLDGGNVYPFKIRKDTKKNIRVWLQDGAGDLENEHGSWPATNIAMANSLKYRDYDFHFVWGNGTHSRNGGHAELAEEMIWLWRDYDPAKTSQEFTADPAEKDKPFFRVTTLNR